MLGGLKIDYGQLVVRFTEPCTQLICGVVRLLEAIAPRLIMHTPLSIARCP